MEYSVAVIIFLVQLISAIASYKLWLRHRSRLQTAKAELKKAINEHFVDGTLEDYLEKLPEALTAQGSERPLRRYFWIGAALVVGVLMPYLARSAELGLLARSLIGTLSIIPFVWLVSGSVAQEVDDNRILELGTTIKEELPTSMANGSVEHYIAAMD